MIETISIVLEVIVVVVALLIAKSKRKMYGYGLALTFAIYVLFDSAREFNLEIPEQTLNLLFLVASISALWSLVQIYRGR